MKIIGMMTVRDEEDILEESLSHAAKIYDHVLCVDCGSLDTSPNIIKRLAFKYENVHFLRKLPPMTPMQVKRHIWSAFRKRLSSEDWWVFADADEFVSDNAREVLGYSLAHQFDHVDGEHVNFYFTEADRRRELSQEPEIISAVSVRERLNYYRYHTHQLRFFRNLPWLRWNFDSSTPQFLSSRSDLRVQFIHYQYRNLNQIERRIKIRQEEYHRSDPADIHWRISRVDDAISADDDAALRFYEKGVPFIRDAALPSPLKESTAKRTARYAKNIVHGLLAKRSEEKWFDDFDL